MQLHRNSVLLLLLELIRHVTVATGSQGFCSTGSDTSGGSCNFTELKLQLQAVLQSKAGPRLAAAMVSLNLKLRSQLLTTSACCQDSMRLARIGGAVSCKPDPSLGDLMPALTSLKADVKSTLASLTASSVGSSSSSGSSTPVASDYEKFAFDVYNVFSGAFMDFVRKLASMGDSSGAAEAELKAFGVFYARLSEHPPLLELLGDAGSKESLASRATPSSLEDCGRFQSLWRNLVGVGLQLVTMQEIAGLSDGPNAASAWQGYLSVSEFVSSSSVTCRQFEADAAASARSAGGIGGIGSVGDGQLRGSDVALCVLVPLLLLALLAVLAYLLLARRRRRRRRQRRWLMESVGVKEGSGGVKMTEGEESADQAACRQSADGVDQLAVTTARVEGEGEVEESGEGGGVALRQQVEWSSDDPDEV